MKRKRSVQLSPHQNEQLSRTIAQQIDLEIALKKRLLVAANSRVEWALLLRNSIANSGARSSYYPPTAFRDAALTTYEAIESPCHFITPPSDHGGASSSNGKSPVPNDIRAPDVPRTRKRVTLGLRQASTVGPLLFEDRSTSTPVTLKLVCTGCSRSDFPTIQGFLNHCRLAHSQIYGTHDDCIQACGVIVDDNERTTMLAAGVEIKAIQLPSLKRIFERAVGLGPSILSSSKNTDLSQSVTDRSDVSTHLSQTLGLHKDSPALAPFLGKEIKKKCIHVYDDGGSIDLVSLDGDSVPQRPPWLVKRRKRYITEPGWSPNAAILAKEQTGVIDGPQHVLNEATGDQGSRFHVTRRILVADRSLYLPQNKRLSSTKSVYHSHRWQLSISSPSYEQHITAFLSCLTVTCITQPPVFTTPIVISEPPFVACSTTDRPFLARLSLEWAGNHNNVFEVEHWVELDQSKAARPVLGDEQMLDIELDRKTVFRPVRDIATTVPWNGDGDYGKVYVSSSGADALVTKMIEVPNALEPEHIRLLRSIVPQFPITSQDSAIRQTSRVPYLLYPSSAKLLSLMPGRRKAVEWSRALAIRTEYDALKSSFSANTPLTTADIYRWLESEGYFPRRRPKVHKPASKPVLSQPVMSSAQNLEPQQRFCSVCGVDVHFHAPGIPLDAHDQKDGESAGFRCPAEWERRWTPLVHVYALAAPLRIPYWALHHDHDHDHISSSSPRDFVSLAHPHLTQFLRREVRSLHLSCFDRIFGAKEECEPRQDHELVNGYNREEVETALAPYAFLAIALQKMVKDLVGSALQVARDSQSRTKITPGQTRGTALVSLLTPTHVLQGLVKGAELGGAREALFKSFARVGTLLEVNGTATSATQSGIGAPSIAVASV